MALIVTIAGSPSPGSRTSLLAKDVRQRLQSVGFEVASIDVRDLPADDLLAARLESPALREAVGLVERANGVVVATPVYKAAYSGLLKAFLDVLPQFGLGGKAVLPLATGGTPAHVLAIDYALRPVLISLGARPVTTGLFLIDKQLERVDDGVRIDPAIEKRLADVVNEFAAAVAR